MLELLCMFGLFVVGCLLGTLGLLGLVGLAGLLGISGCAGLFVSMLLL